MQCPNCGKTGFVNIGGKRFCSNCGAKLPTSGPATMSDIKTASGTLDLRSTSATETATAARLVAKPASQLHGKQVGGPAVLDLRNASPKSAPTVETTATPKAKESSEAVVPTPAKLPELSLTKSAVASPAPSPEPEVKTAAEDAPDPALAATPEPAPTPTPEPTEPTPASTEPAQIKGVVSATPISRSNLMGPSQLRQVNAAIPKSPLITKMPTAAPTATNSAAAGPELPPQVSTQIEAMQPKPATPTPTPTPTAPHSPALQEALDKAKQSEGTGTLLKIGAGVAAIALMAGIVWYQNSPKLAFHNAALKAGIEASLPTYIPSSYHQAGAAQVSDNQLTLNFASPSSDKPLAITERRSNWDSNSLRENYVSQQTDNFLAVQGQGLTIYLYNDQATWINHGVWYQMSGTSKLSREQILKIAYGL